MSNQNRISRQVKECGIMPALGAPVMDVDTGLTSASCLSGPDEGGQPIVSQEIVGGRLVCRITDCRYHEINKRPRKERI